MNHMQNDTYKSMNTTVSSLADRIYCTASLKASLEKYVKLKHKHQDLRF
jgi:hypothetical protein